MKHIFTVRFFAIFSIFVLLSVVLCSFLPINDESEVYERTIRLHVLANSDSDEDQALKLKVRDAVLELIGEYIRDCSDRESAAAAIEEGLGAVKRVAEETVKAEGFEYGVTVELGAERYPTRSYESVSLPAGVYYSLRVKIGDAEGANWWCVLYPPLCLSSAKAKDELAAAGFTQNQIRLLTESDDLKYVLKFRILEVFEAFTEFIGRKNTAG